MFGIGISELILIAVVALVVVGPKNLPTTLRAVGRAIREFQRASRELREQAGFDEVVDEVTRPLREGLAGIEADVLREHEDTSMEYPEAGPDDYGAMAEGASWYPDEMPPEAAGLHAPPTLTTEADAVAPVPAPVVEYGEHSAAPTSERTPEAVAKTDSVSDSVTAHAPEEARHG